MIRKTLAIGCHYFASFNANKDYYKILNLKTTATTEQIKKSFRILAKQYHPDANKGNDEKFKQINQAYQVLSTDLTKRDYDEARRGQASGQTQRSGPSSTYSPYGGYQGQKYREQYPNQQYNTYRGYSQEQGWNNRAYREETIKNTYDRQQKQFFAQYNSARPRMTQQEFDDMLFRRGGRPQGSWQDPRFDSAAQRQFEQMLKKNAQQARITRQSVRKAYEAEQKQREAAFKAYREKRNEDIAQDVKDKAWKMAEGIKDNVEGVMKVGKYVKENIGSAVKIGKFLWDQYKNYKKK